MGAVAHCITVVNRRQLQQRVDLNNSADFAQQEEAELAALLQPRCLRLKLHSFVDGAEGVTDCFGHLVSRGLS